jgi:hypothetical protein
MPNSPKTAAARRAANERARIRAYYANPGRREWYARVIQARVRGMLTRLHLANPAWGRTYANVVAGRPGLGHRAVQRRVFNRPNNMRAYGARIRAGIRHGPEHYVASRSTALWRANARAMKMSAAARASMKGVNGPRGAVSRRTPSPNRNNNNLYR